MNPSDLLDVRNLPTPVLERLAANAGDRPGEGERSGVDAVQRSRIVEARAFAIPEVRRDENGVGTVEGYATVFDYPYDVCGGPSRYGWTEEIVSGACTKSLLERDRVGLLINHDSDTAFGLPLAATYATGAGLLTLDADKVGLRMSATFGPTNVVRAFLLDALEDRIADSMSFAFRAIRQEWNDDYTHRRILELMLFDVSVVCYPANPAALVQLRGADVDDRSAPPAGGMTLALARASADALRLRRN